MKADSSRRLCDTEDCLKILLVDDHKLVREGIRRQLDGQPDICVAAEASDAEGTIKRVRDAGPHVVLLDVKLKNSTEGFHICKTIKRQHPGIKVILMSGEDLKAQWRRIRDSNADGFIDKACGQTHLPSLIRQVVTGGFVVSPALAGRAWESFVASEEARVLALGEEATEVQHRMLSLLGDGKTNKEIAGELGKSTSRVANMLTRLYRTLGVKTRLEAVKKWRKARRA